MWFESVFLPLCVFFFLAPLIARVWLQQKPKYIHHLDNYFSMQWFYYGYVSLFYFTLRNLIWLYFTWTTKLHHSPQSLNSDVFFISFSFDGLSICSLDIPPTGHARSYVGAGLESSTAHHTTKLIFQHMCFFWQPAPIAASTASTHLAGAG